MWLNSLHFYRHSSIQQLIRYIDQTWKNNATASVHPSLVYFSELILSTLSLIWKGLIYLEDFRY